MQGGAECYPSGVRLQPRQTGAFVGGVSSKASALMFEAYILATNQAVACLRLATVDSDELVLSLDIFIVAAPFIRFSNLLFISPRLYCYLSQHKINYILTSSIVLVAGQPLDQKVVQYGPFVLNSEEEVYQAMMDFQTQSNGFERAKGWRSEIGKTMVHQIILRSGNLGSLGQEMDCEEWQANKRRSQVS